MRRHLFTSLIVLTVFGLTSGLPRAAVEKDAQKKKVTLKAPPANPVWPLPPEEPRIKYLRSFRSVEDFKKKKDSRWKTLLLGNDPVQRPPEALIKPYGVAASKSGRVYVTDTAARRVFVFDAEQRDVGFLGDSGAGKVTKPIGVAVDDSQDRVFVADATLRRIFGYGPDGELAVSIGREGEFENPSGLAADSKLQRIYLADSKKHQIFCYSSVDGRLVRTIGVRGTEQGQFNFPTNLFVDAESRLYVADTLNFRVAVFDAEGNFLKSIGSQGDTPGKLNRPKGVGVDSEGHIYVADTSFNNFQIFDQDGQLLLFVGTAGRDPGEFLLPAGLFVDSSNYIYVVDQGNARVQMFQYLAAAQKQP